MKRAIVALLLSTLAGLAAFSGLGHAQGPDGLAVVGPLNCATAAPPVVAYDISKGQLASDVESFLNDLILDGFSAGSISGSIPSCVDVLIVLSTSGVTGLAAPYTPAEATTIKNWVDAGHALMLFGEWGSYRAGADALFAAFGYGQGGPGALTDPSDFDPLGGSDWVIYQPDNFAAHPMLEGVSTIELLRSSWLTLPASAVVTSDVDSSPSRVPVMAALASGGGCAVLSSDSNWVANAIPTSNAGYPKRDNSLLARQAVSWLNSCGQGPIARPGGPYSVSEGSSVTLSAAASSDPAGDALTFAWDLDNDGLYDDAFVVNPIFSAATRDDGVYPVGVRASDGVYTDTGRTTVSVLNVAPGVWLTATATDVTAGAPITFTGSFVDPGALDTHTTRWRFGDGTPDLFGLLTRAHAFGAAGAYTVSLMVTDDDGGAGTATLPIRVSAAAPLTPTASAGGPYTVPEGSSVLLNGSGSSDPAGRPLTYAWDLDGDGLFDDAFLANPIFSAAALDDGARSVSLRVSNGSLTDTHATIVSVTNVAPGVSLAASASTARVGQVVTFTGALIDPGAFDTHTATWRFDDGTPAAGSLIGIHAYTLTGTHVVTLTVADDDGGSGSASYSLLVLPPLSTPSTVFLPLIARNLCLAAPVYADIALVMDTSGSMGEPAWAGGPAKLQLAKSAAADFLNLLVFPGDQAAIVSFDSDAALDHILSNNRTGLIAALNGLAAGGVTRMDLGLALARGELIGTRHVSANGRYVLFLTDGRPTGTDEATVLAEAALTKAQGIALYTIGLGSDVNEGLLRAMASSPDHYYYSPSSAQLSEIYRRIAGELRCRP